MEILFLNTIDFEHYICTHVFLYDFDCVLMFFRYCYYYEKFTADGISVCCVIRMGLFSATDILYGHLSHGSCIVVQQTYCYTPVFGFALTDWVQISLIWRIYNSFLFATTDDI